MDITSYLLGKKAGGGGSSGGLDWQAIGYDSTPQAIIDGYDYAVEIQENWENVADLTNKFKFDDEITIMPLVDTSNAIYMNSMFNACTFLSTVPLLNTSNVTNMSSMFENCKNITTIPLLDTSKVTNMSALFRYCNKLTTVPLLNTSNVTRTNNTMFGSVYNLTDESLDNILQMCINMTKYTGTKTLSGIGINNTTYYPASRIEALTHYQDFINAGWTIGY